MWAKMWTQFHVSEGCYLIVITENAAEWPVLLD